MHARHVLPLLGALVVLGFARPADASVNLGLGADWIEGGTGELNLTLGADSFLARNISVGGRAGVAFFGDSNTIAIPLDVRLKLHLQRIYFQGLVGPWFMIDARTSSASTAPSASASSRAASTSASRSGPQGRDDAGAAVGVQDLIAHARGAAFAGAGIASAPPSSAGGALREGRLGVHADSLRDRPRRIDPRRERGRRQRAQDRGDDATATARARTHAGKAKKVSGRNGKSGSSRAAIRSAPSAASRASTAPSRPPASPTTPPSMRMIPRTSPGSRRPRAGWRSPSPAPARWRRATGRWRAPRGPPSASRAARARASSPRRRSRPARPWRAPPRRARSPSGGPRRR